MNSNNKKVFIEWTVAILLLFIVVEESPYLNYYHLSPLSAHEQSERTYYYGPSEIVEEIDLGEVQIFLGKYKEWFSANSVEKHAYVFWQPGGDVGGTKIDQNKDISHSWSGSKINEDLMLMKVYGIVTNSNIEKVELDVVEGEFSNQIVTEDDIKTFSYTLEDHRMFLFHWNEKIFPYRLLSLRGIDENNVVVFEEDLS